MRLIDADALLERAIPLGWSTPLWVSDIAIDDASTIDAVPVVRCKDCKYYKSVAGCLDGYCGMAEWYRRYKYPDDYCSRGERKIKEAVKVKPRRVR